jgi:hypothetical protein
MAAILSNKEEQEFESYIKALLETGPDKQVFDRLSDLEIPPPYRLRVKVLYSSKSPKQVIESLVSRHLLVRLGKESATYSYEGDLNEVPFFVAEFETEIGPHANAIIAICKTAHWISLRRFFKSHYPDLVPILLSQSELINGAKNLKRITGHEVRVRTLSARENLQGATGKRRRSIREWTDEELDEALINIQDRRQMLISFEVDFFPTIGEHSHVRPRVSCKIRKDGEIEVTGSFCLAFEAVATLIARVGGDKLQFLHGRGLRESNYTPNPLAIDFSQDVFTNIKTIRNFVQLLKVYPHSMRAVMHGNPHAHVHMTDLFDGSSFDVWAVSPQRVVLIPGLKASEAAFERFIHYIFDVFREGQIATYGKEKR